MPSMRIGFDAKRAFHNKTGLGNYSRFVLDALHTHHPENQYFAYTPGDRGLFKEYPQELTKFPATAFHRKLKSYWRYAGITSELKNDAVNVYHGLSHEIPQGLSKAGIASVVTMHDLIFERLPKLFNPIDRIIYRHKFQSACRRADAIVAISEQTKRDLVDLYSIDPTRIRVIYQDCNPLFKQPVINKTKEEVAKKYQLDRPYIISVGTIEKRKNQLRLVEAFATLPENDFELILVGRATAYAQEIRNFVQAKKLENRVRILENIPTPDLPALYANAAVFAYISVYEGFGIPILEALHSGAPVLAAKGSCLEEAGGPGGLYADPTSTEDIAVQLSRLIDSEDLRSNLVIKGKTYIERFTGEKIADQLVALYQELY